MLKDTITILELSILFLLQILLSSIDSCAVQKIWKFRTKLNSNCLLPRNGIKSVFYDIIQREMHLLTHKKLHTWISLSNSQSITLSYQFTYDIQIIHTPLFSLAINFFFTRKTKQHKQYENMCGSRTRLSFAVAVNQLNPEIMPFTQVLSVESLITTEPNDLLGFQIIEWFCCWWSRRVLVNENENTMHFNAFFKHLVVFNIKEDTKLSLIPTCN